MSGTYKVNGDKLTGLTVYSTLPVGTVIATVSTSEVGFLAFDGSEYNGADYPELYNKVKNLTAFQSETEGYFKLPNLAGRTIQQAESELGVLIEAGLPNLVGTLGNNGGFFDGDGVFETDETVGKYFQDGSGGTPRKIKFDASKGNAIYGNSNTVQPPAITLNFLIKATDYSSLPQNAIDDTRVTNANVHSALQTQTEIKDAFEWQLLATDQSAVIPTNVKEVLVEAVFIENNVRVVMGNVIITKANIDYYVTSQVENKKIAMFPCNDTSRMFLLFNYSNRTLSIGSDSSYHLWNIYYR